MATIHWRPVAADKATTDDHSVTFTVELRNALADPDPFKVVTLTVPPNRPTSDVLQAVRDLCSQVIAERAASVAADALIAQAMAYPGRAETF